MLNRLRNCKTLRINDFKLRLEHCGINNPEQEVLWLISRALGEPPYKILARQNFTDDEISRIEKVISRREKHEPLQYILGEADFFGRDFFVGPRVLIPRHDTETLILAVKKIFAPDEKFCFLDWGTGSGCIAITILLEFVKSFAFMLEINPEAASYAEKNLSRYNLHDRARIISSLTKIFEQDSEDIVKTISSLTEFYSQKNFDMIISNPPYIPSDEINGLEVDVKDYEPHSALDGGADGMKFYSEIFALALTCLKPGGYIILETGDIKQVEALKNFHDEFNFAGEIFDAGNFPRCLIFRRKE